MRIVQRGSDSLLREAEEGVGTERVADPDGRAERDVVAVRLELVHLSIVVHERDRHSRLQTVKSLNYCLTH